MEADVFCGVIESYSISSYSYDRNELHQNCIRRVRTQKIFLNFWRI